MFGIKKFDFLIALYIFLITAAELMGGKSFFIADLGFIKLNASVAIFLFPFIFTINDVITEVYGAERTRSIIRSGLVMVALIIFLSFLFTALPASTRFAANESAYDTIFGLSARIAAASLTAFAVAEFLDVLIFVKLRKKLGKSRLWLRNNASNFAAQFIDTTIFMTLAFYSLNRPVGDNVSFLVSLILPYWLLKCFMSVIETPLVYAGVKWLKSDSAKQNS